jgi:hypothetical protein
VESISNLNFVIILGSERTDPKIKYVNWLKMERSYRTNFSLTPTRRTGRASGRQLVSATSTNYRYDGDAQYQLSMLGLPALQKVR